MSSGAGAAPPVKLRAGALTAELHGAALRQVRCHGYEVVRAVYVAVRDRNWGTVPGRLRCRRVEQHQDRFRVTLEVTHVHAEAGFRWYGEIAGSASDGLSVSVDGVALRDFQHNRIGISVLHPLALAGAPVAVTTPTGQTVGAFPVRIAAHQPLRDITAMSYPVGGGITAQLTFDGEIFETEDQRNWTDASYKTYAPPLSRPFPVQIRRGERIRQAMRLRVRATAPAPPPPAVVPPDAGGAVSVSAAPVGRLPALGLVSPARAAPLSDRERRRLGSLGLSHLRVELDATSANWRERLAYAGAEADQLGVPLEAAVLAATGGQVAAVVDALAERRRPLARLLVFAPDTWVTTRELAGAARSALHRHRLRTPLGGGSYAWFAQLNRYHPRLPLRSELAFAISPQVHAEAETTLRENLGGLAPVVAQARAIAGRRPLAIGPVTLKPRFQPTATGPPVPVGRCELPLSVDAHQPSWQAAGWLVGALQRLAQPGVGSLTLFETLGWRGVIQPDVLTGSHPAFPAPAGAVFPVFHVLAALAAVRGGTVLTANSDHSEAVAVLAVARGTRLVVLVANLTDTERPVHLRLPAGDYRLWRPADHSDRPTFHCGSAQLPAHATLELPPYALARLTRR